MLAYVVNALANSYMFYCWSKLSYHTKSLVWQYYGHFTCCMIFGSIFGAFDSLCYMQTIAYNYKANDLRQMNTANQVQIQTSFALSSQWQSAHFICYSFGFLFLTFAQFMILNRLLSFIQNFTAINTHSAGRVFLLFIVAGNIVGICGNVAAASFSARASILNLEAAAAWERKDNATFTSTVLLYGQESQRQSTAVSVQQYSEVFVLLVIIVAFASATVLSLQRLSQAEVESSHCAFAVKKLRRKISVSVALIFTTFLLRSVYSIFRAFSDGFSNFQIDCRTGLCSSCYNVYTNMAVWTLYNPYFPNSIILISSPLASLVALWGMTSGRMRSHIQDHRAAKDIEFAG
jgi:hypothetical protein